MKSLTQYIIEKQEENKDKKIIESFIKFVEIKSKSELLNLLKNMIPMKRKRLVFGFLMKL